MPAQQPIGVPIEEIAVSGTFETTDLILAARRSGTRYETVSIAAAGILSGALASELEQVSAQVEMNATAIDTLEADVNYISGVVALSGSDISTPSTTTLSAIAIWDDTTGTSLGQAPMVAKVFSGGLILNIPPVITEPLSSEVVTNDTWFYHDGLKTYMRRFNGTNIESVELD